MTIALSVLTGVTTLVLLQIIYSGLRTRIDFSILAMGLVNVGWSTGVALFLSGHSVLVCTVGLYLTELCIAAVLPVVLWYIGDVLVPARDRHLWAAVILQGAVAVLLAALLFATRSLTVELSPAGPAYTFHTGLPLYLYMAYNALAPLTGMVLLLRVHSRTRYRRDLLLVRLCIAVELLALACLQLRFLFPLPLGHAVAAMVAFVVFYMLYNAMAAFGTRNISYVRLADYVSTVVTTPFLLLSPEGRVLACNEAAYAFFGMGKTQLMGRQVQSLFTPGNCFAPFSKTREGNTRRHYDVRAHNNIICQVDVSYIYDRFNELKNIMFVVNDVTEKMELIELMEQARTRAEEASAHAEEANRSKTYFLARTSHEIRTPMNAIVGMSELILRENTTPEVRGHARGIQQASDTLLAIINDILDFSKIESGRMEIVPTGYSFAAMLGDVINIIRIRLMDKPVEFTVNLDNRLPAELVGDEVRVRQVLLNILGNAVKYTQEGFIHLEVTGEVFSQAGMVSLRFDVADSGAGIREEDQKRLFEDFVQVDLRKNRGVEGTGLGLVITRNLLHAMDGDISVKSTYGKGSVFSIYLPQLFHQSKPLGRVRSPHRKRLLLYETRRRHARSIGASCQNLDVAYDWVQTQSTFEARLQEERYTHVLVAAHLQEGAHQPCRLWQGEAELVILTEAGQVAGGTARTLAAPVHCANLADMLSGVYPAEDGTAARQPFTAPAARVLVVDDIFTNLRVAEGLLRPYGMQVDTCLSGADALDLVLQNRYDVVFMDHMMPEMDGIEATVRIRAMGKEDPYYATLPVIALTANAVPGIREMFLERGLTDYLAKPIEVTKLALLLEKWIPKDKKEAPRPAGAAAPGRDAGFSVPGVDTGLGLSLAGGKPEAYRAVLTSFCDDSRILAGRIEACLEEDDLAQYTIHVHALKSATAAIGAQELSRRAALLEAAGKERDRALVRRHTTPFLQELKALAGRLEDALSDPADADRTPGGQAVLHSRVQQLQDALDTLELSQADRLLEELSQYSWPPEVQQHLDALAQNILMADLEEAENRVHALLA